MRSPRRAAAGIAAATAALALAGCSDSGSSVMPSSSSTTATIGPSLLPSSSPPATPSRTTDAAGEAKAALLRYRETVDRVFQSGGRLRDELTNVAVARQLAFLQQQADFLAQQKQRQVGDIQYTAIRSVTIAPKRGALSTSATIVVCNDSSGRKVVDSSGRSVLPANIPKIFLTTFTLVNTKPGDWLVANEQDQQVKTCA